MDSFNWKLSIGSAETGFFHHAFLIEGNHENIKPTLLVFLREEFKISPAGNPDFYIEDFSSFGIDESRILKAMQLRRAFTEGAKKIFIITINSVTLEAQNSLLKIFEEPTADTHFFLLTPSVQFFLPTLLSRVVCIQESNREENFEVVRKFFKEPYPRRLEFAVEISKDSLRAQRFFDELIRFYYQKKVDGVWTEKETHLLELVSKYRIYAHARAPSLKMMLEHLALVTPL